MPLSIFELFRVGCGPSSSQTVGPMRAAYRFVQELSRSAVWSQVAGVTIELFGSLAMGCEKHRTLGALLAGLEGNNPEEMTSEKVDKIFDRVNEEGVLCLLQKRKIAFAIDQVVVNRQERLTPFGNSLRLTACNGIGIPCVAKDFYCLSGGWVVAEGERLDCPMQWDSRAPYPYQSAKRWIQWSLRDHLSLAEVVLSNERTWRSEVMITRGLSQRRKIVTRELHTYPSRRLQGGFGEAIEKLTAHATRVAQTYGKGEQAMAAPTFGTGGVLPAVIAYACHRNLIREEQIEEFLLIAGGIGLLYKSQIPLADWEGGCQSEIGLASAMSSGGLTRVMGGTPGQVCRAASLALEHNLGLPCQGLQVHRPCLARNGMAAVKAVEGAYLALQEPCDQELGASQLDRAVARLQEQTLQGDLEKTSVC